tara:strand:+ start:1754 stop:1921 length:168 start_codon:yes stop_codon:yes gene_type:complete
MLVQKLIIKEALRLITKKFKLNDVLKYVQEPNELDEEVEQLKSRIEMLETIIKEK